VLAGSTEGLETLEAFGFLASKGRPTARFCSS